MSRKHVHRDRRRTDKTMDEAFVALERGETVLALRLARRAREAGAMNPRILFDHATIALRVDEVAEAEDSLRAAIAQAPGFTAAFSALAELQWRADKRPAALRLIERACELDPADARAAGLLWQFRELAPELAAPAPVVVEPLPITARTENLDLVVLAAALVARGHAVLSALLSPVEAAATRNMLASAHELDREIAVGDSRAAQARYRWFLELPPLVADLQAELYARCAQFGDRLAGTLGSDRRLPATIAAWRRHRDRDAGHRPGARVVQLPANGVLGPEIVTDAKAFPLRVLIDLGPGDGEVTALTLMDQRPGRKVAASTAATRPGDAVVFGQRERLARVGGVFGLQRVAWSLGPVASERWLLDLPFDDV